ncbi:hypothetical protein Acsp06_17750 [Actinomycetospora sp. NBRC 106375]|uniref:DUF1097 domain-containing protein n=1 Tax=Actinomycetospora sp. NBRC 106375 TaxID=3032207 RepID=UPI0024A1A038|nr:DUF1097 domain-containing protein [Actinomycetospora sp. NBRC 106375]GLZ45590.1 hypothetical protein Acsp06_17750 [Actinomycetospora sp. NBRC 106375]
MRLRIPNEIFSSILAATTAFIGGNALHLPVWAIFIGWAATYLAGGPQRATFRALYPTMAAGATFALVIVLLDTALAPSDGQLAQNAVLALLILVVNTALMYSGRTRLLALIPGMFLGFASYFATMFGGFGFAPENLLAAWVSVLVMLALGPLYALIAHAVTAPREERALEPADAR